MYSPGVFTSTVPEIWTRLVISPSALSSAFQPGSTYGVPCVSVSGLSP